MPEWRGTRQATRRPDIFTSHYLCWDGVRPQDAPPPEHKYSTASPARNARGAEKGADPAGPAPLVLSDVLSNAVRRGPTRPDATSGAPAGVVGRTDRRRIGQRRVARLAPPYWAFTTARTFSRTPSRYSWLGIQLTMKGFSGIWKPSASSSAATFLGPRGAQP